MKVLFVKDDKGRIFDLLSYRNFKSVGIGDQKRVYATPKYVSESADEIYLTIDDIENMINEDWEKLK